MMFCPVCGSLGATNFIVLPLSNPQYVPSTVVEIGAEKRLVHCPLCSADFTSEAALVDPDTDRQAQALVNYDFYRARYDDSLFDREFAINEGILQAFERFLSRRVTYVEIGIGLGMLTRTAASMFETVIGLDLEIETAQSIGRVPTNMQLVRHPDYAQELRQHPHTTIDALCAWHVLEHLPDPHSVIKPLLLHISEGGVMFGQIPLLRAEYVIESHYVFYNEVSLTFLLRPYGLEPVYFERDETNDFMSFCFRKGRRLPG